MKTRILIFSSLLCLCGAFSAWASDCTGEGCDVEPMAFEEFEWTTTEEVREPTNIEQPAAPTWMESDARIATMPIIQPRPIVMQNAKLLTIKAVPEDTRPAL